MFNFQIFGVIEFNTRMKTIFLVSNSIRWNKLFSFWANSMQKSHFVFSVEFYYNFLFNSKQHVSTKKCQLILHCGCLKFCLAEEQHRSYLDSTFCLHLDCIVKTRNNFLRAKSTFSKLGYSASINFLLTIFDIFIENSLSPTFLVWKGYASVIHSFIFYEPSYLVSIESNNTLTQIKNIYKMTFRSNNKNKIMSIFIETHLC